MIAVAQPLATVMASIKNADEFSYAIRDFADRFHESPDPSLLATAPDLLEPTLQDDGVADAWVASVAAHLAETHCMPTPLWTRGAARCLTKPWFAAKSPNLKAILLQESPAAFRVRNLFVSANALHRA
jgi:hypothetical protein